MTALATSSGPLEADALVKRQDMRLTTFNSRSLGFVHGAQSASGSWLRGPMLATIMGFLQASRRHRSLLGSKGACRVLGLGCVLAITTSAGVAMGDPTSCIQAHGNAQELQSAGRLLEARKLFESCAARECPQMIQKDCKVMGKAVGLAIPTLIIAAVNQEGLALKNFRIELDGIAVQPDGAIEPIPVDPGIHHLTLLTPGRPATKSKIVVHAEDGNQRVTVQLVAPPESDTKFRDTGYLFAGVGAAALASFAGFGISGYLDQRELESHARQLADRDDLRLVDRMRRKYVIADVSLGIGLVSLGAATYLLYVTQGSSNNTATRAKTAIFLRGSAEGGAFFVHREF